MRHNPAVVEIKKAQAWMAEDRAWNLLPEGGHEAKLRPPFIQKYLIELGGLHTAGVNRQPVCFGKPGHQQFIIPCVVVLPEP